MGVLASMQTTQSSIRRNARRGRDWPSNEIRKSTSCRATTSLYRALATAQRIWVVRRVLDDTFHVAGASDRITRRCSAFRDGELRRTGDRPRSSANCNRHWHYRLRESEMRHDYEPTSLARCANLSRCASRPKARAGLCAGWSLTRLRRSELWWHFPSRSVKHPSSSRLFYG